MYWPVRTGAGGAVAGGLELGEAARGPGGSDEAVAGGGRGGGGPVPLQHREAGRGAALIRAMRDVRLCTRKNKNVLKT